MKKLTVKERLGIVWLVLFGALVATLATVNTIGGLDKLAVSDLPFYFWCLIACLVILFLIIIPFIPVADPSKPAIGNFPTMNGPGRALLGIFILGLSITIALRGPATAISYGANALCLLIVSVVALVRVRYNKRRLQ